MKKHSIIVLIIACLCLINSTKVNAECPRADLTGDCFVGLDDFAIMASEWLIEGTPDPNGMVWVYINDPGVPPHEGFDGEVSNYETTNAQYCQFLNEALASGDIRISGNVAYGASGSNSGEDYIDEVYYDLAGEGSTNDEVTNGGAARINYISGVFSVDSGFEDHPVTYVSWYGATAFCNYYGYRLPTEWEWQAVADYDGTFIYGCGLSINNGIANYYGSNHPYGTTIVGKFGSFGYTMCDMAGNVYEWTSTWEDNPIVVGGSWGSQDYDCTVSNRDTTSAHVANGGLGFRACR